METLTFDDQVADAVTAITALPGISKELAQNLVNSGFHTAEDLKQIEPGDLEGIQGLEEHTDAIIAAAQGNTPEATSEETAEKTSIAEEDESIAEPVQGEESSPDEPVGEVIPEAEGKPTIEEKTKSAEEQTAAEVGSPQDPTEESTPESEEKPIIEEEPSTEKPAAEESPEESKD